jgi:hypothetical protein
MFHQVDMLKDRVFKTLRITILTASLLLLLPQSAAAQGITLTDVSQQVSYRYGDSLTFRVQASADSAISGARLVVEVANRTGVHSEAIPITPGLSVAVSHTVGIEVLDLDPVGEIVYHWDFMDQAGREYSGPTGSIWYHDTSVPWTWVTQQDGAVTVYTNSDTSGVSQAALEISLAAIVDDVQLLGVNNITGLRVYIYPELAPLANSLRLHGQIVEDWVAAAAYPDQQTVIVAAESGPDQLETLQRDLPHMITHVIIGKAAGAYSDSVPGWFNEGSALNSSSEADPTLEDTLLSAVREEGLIPLEQLCTPSFAALDHQEATLAYAESASVMAYITNRHGPSAVHSLMNGYASGLSCQDAVTDSLGVSLAELESQWHNDLLSQAARAPQEEASLWPWVAVIIASFVLAMLFVAPQPAAVSAGRGEYPADEI